ncbi:MAG: hypothetical protein KBD06_01830 [Candidatus Pacebacteria bacterium]|nr:hypothetical protein [Candidatus Paceibacterota bacterium]
MFAEKIVWKLAKRPTPQQVREYIEGYLGGAGTIESRGDKIVITLPGTPSVLAYDTREFYRNLGGDTVREIEVVLRGECELIVQRSVQDSLSRAVQSGLSSMFYGLQGYEDQEKERAEAES